MPHSTWCDLTLCIITLILSHSHRFLLFQCHFNSHLILISVILRQGCDKRLLSAQTKGLCLFSVMAWTWAKNKPNHCKHILFNVHYTVKTVSQKPKQRSLKNSVCVSCLLDLKATWPVLKFLKAMLMPCASVFIWLLTKTKYISTIFNITTLCFAFYKINQLCINLSCYNFCWPWYMMG